MPPDPARRLRARVTLRQLGVLIVLVAVALAVLAPIGRSTRDVRAFAMLGALEVPYALLLPFLLLVRGGPLKVWLLSVLCVEPLLAFAVYVHYVAVTGRLNASFALPTPSMPMIAVVGVADVALIPLLVTLGRGILPRTCPACGRFAMLRDPSVPHARDFPGSRAARSCLACGSRFRRARRGPWVDVDLLPARLTLSAMTSKSTLQDDPR